MLGARLRACFLEAAAKSNNFVGGVNSMDVKTLEEGFGMLGGKSKGCQNSIKGTIKGTFDTK